MSGVGINTRLHKWLKSKFTGKYFKIIFFFDFNLFSWNFHYSVKSAHKDIFCNFSECIKRFFASTLLGLHEELIKYWRSIFENRKDCLSVINAQDCLIWYVWDGRHIFASFHQIINVRQVEQIQEGICSEEDTFVPTLELLVHHITWCYCDLMFILLTLEIHRALLIGLDPLNNWVIFVLIIESDSIKIVHNGGKASSSIDKII